MKIFILLSVILIHFDFTLPEYLRILVVFIIQPVTYDPIAFSLGSFLLFFLSRAIIIHVEFIGVFLNSFMIVFNHV